MTRSFLITVGMLLILTLSSQTENSLSQHTFPVKENIVLTDHIINDALIDSLTRIDSTFEQKVVEAEKVSTDLKKANKEVKEKAVIIKKLIEQKNESIIPDTPADTISIQADTTKKKSDFYKLLRSLNLKK